MKALQAKSAKNQRKTLCNLKKIPKEVNMLSKENPFKNKNLQEYFETGKVPKGLDAKLASRTKFLLVHLESAQSIHDIGQGIGSQKRLHKLECGLYSLDINGPYRLLFQMNEKTGEVYDIDIKNTH